MKHTLFILALITATIQTFAQSPRIKLNQITKDSVTGSVLISSPTDSGMVYSRDLFISYGADTFLILGGDTLAATSSIISSVLSDGVTITGNGTTGSELTVDTATVIATKQDLDLYYLDSNPDGYTSNTGTVTSVGGTGTVNGISLSGTVTSSGDLTLGGTLSGVDLVSQVTGTLPVSNGGTGSSSQNFVDLSSAQTVGGAKTFTSALSQSGGDVNFDSGTFFVDESADKVGIGTTNPSATLDIESGNLNNFGLNVNGYMVGTFLDLKRGIIRMFDPIKGDTLLGGFGTSTWAAADGRYDPFFFAGENNNLKFGTSVSGSTTLRMTIENDGDVVIADLAGTGTRTVEATSNGTLQAPSTMMIKENIEQSSYGLSTINELNPVTFYYKDKEMYGSVRDIGFLAEEVYQILPEASGQNADGSYYLDKSKITPVLTKAIQEQQAIIESQATEIEQLKLQIQLILSEIEQIKNN